MTRDSEGNIQKAPKKPSVMSVHNSLASSRTKPSMSMGVDKGEAAKSVDAGKPGADSQHTELHDHGDGSYHTEHPTMGHTEHPTLGHALMHMAHAHEPGSHMHVQHHGGGMSTTHHVHEDGQVQGPHDHQNIEALKDHMDQFLGEEENEGRGSMGGEGDMDESPAMSGGGMY